MESSGVLLLCLLGVASTFAGDVGYSHSHHAPHIVERHHHQDWAGQFTDRAVGSDGQVFEEKGKLQPNHDGSDHVLVKEGRYSYTSPEGVPVHISYTADEHGFHPVGNVIPQPPVHNVHHHSASYVHATPVVHTASVVHAAPVEHHHVPIEHHAASVEHHAAPIVHEVPVEHHHAPIEHHHAPIEHHHVPVEHHHAPIAHPSPVHELPVHAPAHFSSGHY